SLVSSLSRPLVAGRHVLVVEGVELEMLLEPGAIDGGGALDVDPTEPAELDGLYVRLSRDRSEGRIGPRASGAPEARLRKARHRVKAGRRLRAPQRGFYPRSAVSCPSRHSRCIKRGGGIWPIETPATVLNGRSGSR